MRKYDEDLRSEINAINHWRTKGIGGERLNLYLGEHYIMGASTGETADEVLAYLRGLDPDSLLATGYEEDVIFDDDDDEYGEVYAIRICPRYLIAGSGNDIYENYTVIGDMEFDTIEEAKAFLTPDMAAEIIKRAASEYDDAMDEIEYAEFGEIDWKSVEYATKHYLFKKVSIISPTETAAISIYASDLDESLNEDEEA